MSDFFPTPEIPYKEPQDLRVMGASVDRVQVSTTISKVIVSARAMDANQKSMLFRFMLPSHARVVRSFFKAAGVPWSNGPSPIDHIFTVDGGTFLINIDGTAVGQDKIPEAVGEAPSAAYVLEKVTARVWNS